MDLSLSTSDLYNAQLALEVSLYSIEDIKQGYIIENTFLLQSGTRYKIAIIGKFPIMEQTHEQQFPNPTQQLYK